eukprot:IDg12423t1
MYQTMRKNFYWSGMALSCYPGGESIIPHAARERIRLQSNSTALKLFPCSGPLKDIAMDVLSQLWLKSRGRCRSFRKNSLGNLSQDSSRIDVAKAFTRHWEFAYGFPKTVFTDNVKQFDDKFLQKVYRILGVKLQFTNTHHPKANGQTERFKRSILASLSRFSADHLLDWGLYTDALAFEYSTQAHSSSGYAPIEFTVSRMPPRMAMENNAQPMKNFRLV